MMERWTELARAATPQGDALILRQRGGDYDIRFNGWEVMASRGARSEQALARLAAAELDRMPTRILIGGLGMGYTLRAALDLAGPYARIVVCELVPAVADWVRGPLGDLAGRPLDDPRVECRIGNVAATLSAERGGFDLILLDTDNGPDAVLHEPNRVLYAAAGVAMAAQALTPGGVMCFWSADRSSAFERTLDESGLRWRRADMAARDGGCGPEHSIYLVGARSGPVVGPNNG